jgi:dienelactone hydrolase
MSEENVEVVRRVHEAAARRDAAAVLALYDSEVELDASRLGLVGYAGGRGVSSGATRASGNSSVSGTRRGEPSSTTTTS